MQFIRERPPNYDAIAAVFDVRGKPVLFAYADAIYAPCGVQSVAPHLEAHEVVHGTRQLNFDGGVEAWWEKYLVDPAFRLREEVLGHLGEYSWLATHASGRAERRRHLSHVAARLCQPLYRYALTKQEARRLLEDGYQGAKAGFQR